MALAAILMALGQVSQPDAAAPDRTITVALTQLRSAQSDCVFLASGRVVAGISIPAPWSYEAIGAHADVQAVLPVGYDKATLYRLSRSSPDVAKGSTSPVVIVWDEDRRACAVIARIGVPAAQAAEAARGIVDRYGFKADAQGDVTVRFPANPALGAPRANLHFFPDPDPRDDIIVTRVEHRDR